MATTVFYTYDPTALFAGNLQPVSRYVTLAAGSNVAGTPLPRGSVLGVVTASGKVILSVEAATDGSQTPKCILANDTDASAADTITSAYFVGEFADAELNYGTGHSLTTVDAAFAASGQPVFIRDIGTSP